MKSFSFHRFFIATVLFLVALCLIAGAQSLRAEYPAPVESDKQMVVSAQALASQVGVEILNRGGNAIDAAVATAYALAVVHPCCGNLGGGGFMTLHLAETKENIFINFREKAPLAARPDMFLDADGNVDSTLSRNSYLAVGVPGTVLGLDTALETYGTLSRQDVMAPAIALARDGYVLTQADADIFAYGAEAFATEPNVAEIFLPGGQPPQAGDTLVQEKLAKTLSMIAEDGPDAFYRGAIADALVQAHQENGGLFTAEDLDGYHVDITEPVRCDYRGFMIHAAPPPSSGGTTLCEILNIIEAYPLSYLGFNSAQSLHYMAEAMRHAYVDRNNLLGDPDFIENPLPTLLSKDYAAAIRREISPYRAGDSSRLGPGTPPHEGDNTTHLSVVDSQGNAVSLTFTINSYFGSKRMAEDTGFFLNNEMDDFTAKPGAPNLFGLVQGARNAIAPGKRPLSSMNPTIVTKDDEVFLVLGSPGGSRIITITLQGILNVIDHGMNISEAVNSPRVHHQWLPDAISHEPRAFTRDTAEILVRMGHRLSERRPWGALEAIMIVPEDGIPAADGPSAGLDDSTLGNYKKPGMIYGVNDSRRPAGAALAE
ncbi:MAG: gamma-glutamyltransferase [Pseudomonadota bacterium]